MGQGNSMKFIEMTGSTLSDIVNDNELHEQNLSGSGINNESIVRVNQHGDIEVRKANKWSIIGGLLGQFESRVKEKTGLDGV